MQKIDHEIKTVGPMNIASSISLVRAFIVLFPTVEGNQQYNKDWYIPTCITEWIISLKSGSAED